MSNEEAISVGIETQSESEFTVPVIELLAGRGFVTGKSGSGKSNTASVIAEKLLDSGFGLLIIDVDGEYYGLKEEYQILHAGADEECDIQVVPEHAEKIASLALEQNVPIILDVSGYLDDAEAEELLLETSRHLFAKEKKLKKPFLLLVEECHEYIPEGGSVGEVGQMLIKIGKRGRKHGLGIVGISQRPADVKKDFITQCDWLCWHRLTWDNDTKVVGRILGSDYADAIEGLADGEAFLMTDWTGEIQRVQFYRKQTFDAGATPGLEDFERPELKSVSSDLVSELQSISDQTEQRESELADLRQELDKKRQRISELEAELEEARDLSRMADTFAQAMLRKADASYRGGDGTTPAQRQRQLREYERERRRTERRRTGNDGAAIDSHASTPPTDDTAATPQQASEEGTPGDPSTDDDPAAPHVDSEPAPPQTDDHPESPQADEQSATDNETELATDEPLQFAIESVEIGTREAVIRELQGRIEALDGLPLGMLVHYREEGASDPIEAHIAAGGDADRNLAYSRNRALRKAGVIRHAGHGTYTYAVPELIRDAYDDRLEGETLQTMCERVEEAFERPHENDVEPDSSDSPQEKEPLPDVGDDD